MTEAFGGFYRGRRVFITGHTGFKGSWLSLWLLGLGAQVAGYSLRPPTDPSLFDVLGLANAMRSIKGDIRDGDRLGGELRAFKPEVVFHLAAQPLVRRSYAKPVETYETNVLGTVQLLEAARSEPGIRSIVCVTSDKCYENRESLDGYREDDRLGGRDPYSSSKACAEIVVAAYRRSFFPAGSAVISTARAGNVLGGGDWAEDRLIPDCMRGLSAGREILVRNTSALRPWQYILEPLAGYLWLAASSEHDPGRFGDSWNFGPPDEAIVPVERIVALCVEAWGSGRVKVAAIKNAVHEASLLKLDASKAGRWLGWRGIVPIETAVSWTVNWYRRYYRDHQGMREFSESQIDGYLREARARGMAWSGT
jgi:CDP-glucose 4,6-dehydratase